MAIVNDPLAVDFPGAQDAGQAFVLGESSAAQNYANSIKETLADQKRRRALAEAQLSNFDNNIDTKKAWSQDIYGKGGLLERRQDIQSDLAKLSAKYHKNPNDPSINDDVAALEKKKQDLMADAMVSAQDLAHYNKNQDMISADPEEEFGGKFDKAESLKALDEFRNKKLGERVSTPLTRTYFHMDKFYKGFKDRIADTTLQDEVNNHKITKENLLYEVDDKGQVKKNANGDPVPSQSYLKFRQAADAYIEDHPRAVQKTIVDNNLQSDPNGMSAEDKAKILLRKNLEPMMKEKFSDVLASHQKATEAQKNLNLGFDDMLKNHQIAQNANTNYKIKSDDGRVQTVTSPLMYSHPAKGHTTISSNSQMFDATTGDRLQEGQSYDFTGGQTIYRYEKGEPVPYERGRAVDMEAFKSDPTTLAYASELAKRREDNAAAGNPKSDAEIAQQLLEEKGITNQKKFIKTIEVPLDQVSGYLNSKEGGSVPTKWAYEPKAMAKAREFNPKTDHETKYTIKGKAYSKSTVEKAAKASNMTIDEYIKRANL